MSYHYPQDITFADAAFECDAVKLEELFTSAVDALTNLMVENIEAVTPRISFQVHLEERSARTSDAPEKLLHRLLEKLVYWKDVDGLLLRAEQVTLQANSKEGTLTLDVRLAGEPIDVGRHDLGSDIKAITHHRLRVWREKDHWKALVVVDI